MRDQEDTVQSTCLVEQDCHADVSCNGWDRMCNTRSTSCLCLPMLTCLGLWCPVASPPHQRSPPPLTSQSPPPTSQYPSCCPAWPHGWRPPATPAPSAAHPQQTGPDQSLGGRPRLHLDPEPALQRHSQPGRETEMVPKLCLQRCLLLYRLHEHTTICRAKELSRSVRNC